MRRRLLTGFTLIELMVTVAIIAIIAAVALPSYQSQVRKSRRADAVTAVSVIQQAEERWRANNTSYTSTLGTGGLGFTVNGSSQYVSAGGYYTLSVSFPTGYLPQSQYRITATAVSGTSQANDTGCTSLVVNVSGGNATPDSTQTACWSK